MTPQEGRDYTRYTDTITREEIAEIIASVYRLTRTRLQFEGGMGEYAVWDENGELVLSLKELADGTFLCKNPQKLSGLRESIRKDDVRINAMLDQASISDPLRDYLMDLQKVDPETPIFDIKRGRKPDDTDPK